MTTQNRQKLNAKKNIKTILYEDKLYKNLYNVAIASASEENAIDDDLIEFRLMTSP